MCILVSKEYSFILAKDLKNKIIHFVDVLKKFTKNFLVIQYRYIAVSSRGQDSRFSLFFTATTGNN